VSGNFNRLAGFGPVNPGGYGVGYNTKEDRIIFNITSFKDHPGTDSAQFAQALTEAFKRFSLCFPEEKA